MLIRDATDDDWPAIWPIFAEVVRAEETYAFDADMTEDVARSLWMERPPGATAVAVDEAALREDFVADRHPCPMRIPRDIKDSEGKILDGKVRPAWNRDPAF